MSDEEPEMRSFKDARSEVQDRVKILKRYIKKKKPTTKEAKITKLAEPPVKTSTSNEVSKVKVEPNLLHKVNESLPNETLKDFVRSHKLTKIGSSNFQGKKIILQKDPTIAKKTVGSFHITYMNDKKFIPPSVSQDANNFERRTLFRNANRRVPLKAILKKSF